MPKRKWKTRQTVGQQHAAIREKNRFKAEVAEGFDEVERSRRKNDRLLRDVTPLKRLQQLNRLGPAKKEMDKLKEQRKFKQRKEIL